MNYDCCVGQNNVVERILENQCKIIQGKYSRVEFQTALHGGQEMFLRALSLENMVQLVRQLRMYRVPIYFFFVASARRATAR